MPFLLELKKNHPTAEARLPLLCKGKGIKRAE
jgi:hypothetical protein